MAPIHFHLFRHGRVASHRGDIPITQKGRDETSAAALRVSRTVGPSEEIHFFYTPTVRAQETAAVLFETLQGAVGPEVDLIVPREEWAIRNPDQYVAGRRVEMVSTPEAMADQIPDSGATADVVDGIEYYHNFFRSPDRVGYWLRHADPPGEDTVAVGRRIISFCTSFLHLAAERTRRYVCVTHSPVMRAVLMHYLDRDPGEPDWVERIDLALDSSGSSITFRDVTAPLRH